MSIGNSQITRDNILNDVKLLLSNFDFKTSDIYDRLCFDILARKEDILVILKILVNIDSLTTQQADELSKVAGTFLASPIIIGLKSNYETLEDDVVYERHNIPVISPQTLCNIIASDINPEIFAKRGGYYVKIDGTLLKNLREKNNLSLKELADLSHVSRETIYKYEQGNSQTYPETAMALEEILNNPITLPFSIKDIDNMNIALDEKILEPRELIELGYDIKSSTKTPFDAISERQIQNEKLDKLKEKLSDKIDEIEKIQKEIDKTTRMNDLLITNMEKDQTEKKLDNIAKQTEDISSVTEKDAIFILDNPNDREFIEKIPAIYRWELKEMDDIEELLKLIKERKEKAEES